MKQWNRKTGALGEDIAARYLSATCEILERNFSNRFGEVDIIMRDGGVLVFVEVKTKIGTDFGLPEEMATPGKLQKIRHMAAMYTNGKEVSCRIDVVAIVLTDGGEVSRLTHYKNVQ